MNLQSLRSMADPVNSIISLWHITMEQKFGWTCFTRFIMEKVGKAIKKWMQTRSGLLLNEKEDNLRYSGIVSWIVCTFFMTP